VTRPIATISSLSQYAQVIDQLTRDWSDPKHGDITLWCRGQSDAGWHLVPGEYRGPAIDAAEIFSEFELKARPLLREAPRNDWEWYFLMQHHGLRTRLLDWTTGALLALYFALRDGPGEQDAAVWALDAWALNKAALGKAALLTCTERETEGYAPRQRGRRKLPDHPIAVVPPYNSARITVQRGAFTIHGADQKGLDEFPLKRLVQIRVAKDSAVLLKRELRLAGIGEFTVFPDLDGLARELCSVHVEGC
jgi:hypothetical protein